MKNLFTRFLMIVFLFSVFYQAYAAGAPPADVIPDVIKTWPIDESTTQAQPGTNVFVLEFSKDLADAPNTFGANGVFGLVWESEALGYQQVETILYGVGGAAKIKKVGNRKVEIRFATSLKEDETYHITIEDDAIRFADATWFGGVDYVTVGDPEWGFTVDDVTAPEMVDCDNPDNVNGDYAVSIDQNPITICFNEPVQWVPNADPYKIGNIAFYLAAKSDLDPNTEFGGDVLYSSPASVDYYYLNSLVASVNVKSASVSERPVQFDEIRIYPKWEAPSLNTKSAAIGIHVWPVDRDIYLRFAKGLLQDLAGNPFEGIDGSPFDPYSINGDQYWFSTRPKGAIGSSAVAVLEASAFPCSTRVVPLWQNDDIVVTINSEDLEFISDAAITTGNVNQFIKLSVDGVNVPYTVHQILEGSGVTKYLLEPGNLPHKKTLKVDLLGGLIRDNGDLRGVSANTWNFATGDFTPPTINGTINNLLCTNFDLRVTSDETGIVYYAIVKDTLPVAGWPAFPTDITPAEVVKGQVKRTIGTYPNKYDYYWHFYHVADGVGYGKTGVNTKLQWQSATVPPAGPAPAIVGWGSDDFNINSSLTAFEHIDDFTAENHGDNYNIYYFALDNVCEGPYNNPVGTPNGRVTGVTMKDVQLTDCLQPNLTWYYEDIIDDDIDWTFCTDALNPRIQKDGKFALYFADSLITEGIQLVESSLDWSDVITLEVREYNGGTWTGANPWTNVEISAIEEIVKGGKVVGVIVTPLNNYPSQGRARVTLASGSVEDAAGNAINEELVCRKNVEIYNDPWVDVFTVENKELMFPDQFPDLNGVVAEKDGKITIQFNNPMFTPKRDNPGEPVLLPISLNPLALNYVGKYVKLREGDANTAEVTDDIALAIPLSFELYGYDSEGELVLLTAPITQGVVKIVATPQANYKSENWYYVELEKDLQDENRRELSYVNVLGVWDNNLFVDLHEQYDPYPAAPLTGVPSSWTIEGNMPNYFMRFKAEDTVSPELRFVFEKFDLVNYPAGTSIMPYIEEVDSATVFCTDPKGGYNNNTIPVGAIITEWSKIGFDNKDYYVNEDPNGLRPYFKMKLNGVEIPFDVVVLNIFEPVDEVPSYTNDAVWFGFVPFTPLAEGKTYTMEFDPYYQAPQNGQAGIPEGPVFVDDNGNPLDANTLVTFTTCSTQPICFTSDISMQTTVIGGANVAGSLTPSFTVTFANQFVPRAAGTAYVTITGGSKTWQATTTTDFVTNGKTITVPWSSMLPNANVQLDQKTKYLITVVINRFGDVNQEVLGNCQDTMYFWSPDLTAPAILAKSPDINVDVVNNLLQSPWQIDPRNPGELRISWNEKVTPQAGKVIEVWENGTTKRITYTYPSAAMVWDAPNNLLKVTLPKDFLNYYGTTPTATGHFHVDVKAGFVKDVAGNASAELTGSADGLATWTFQTGTNVAPEIDAWTPICLVEPGNMNTEPISATEVKVNKITVTLSEGVVPVAGKKLYVRRAAGSTDLYVVNVTSMTASADKKTYSITPSPQLILPNNDEYNIYVEVGAFKETYPLALASQLSTPDYTNQNFLNCEDSGFDEYVQVPASFAFADISAPTAKIWPEDGNVKVAFNAHGYVKFSEKLIARAGNTPGNPQLVLTQSNIKDWIKVTKETAPGSGIYVALTNAEYVCEFVNLERTHIRVTFLDEAAPAIDGVTANMQDEWKYRIDVNTTGTGASAGYYLQDYMGNYLSNNVAGNKRSTFKTEDITVPMFYATACDVKHNSVKVKFTPAANYNPYAPQMRVYPRDSGTVYYVVKPAGAPAPTSANLYDPAWRTANGAKTVAVPATSTGAYDTWTMSTTVNLTSDYDFVIYAVMQDKEKDIFIAPNYGNAWPTTDPIFVESGDTDPASGAIGLADIRPAPNKNQTVRKWNFCFCDDDAPKVASKEWNTNENVPVDETFKIKFDEKIKFGPDVVISGTGTGTGVITTPEYGYEVRLREWNNNVAVPITLTLNVDSSFTIDPVSELLEETRYYVEIDRWVVYDIAGSNCANTVNVAPPDTISLGTCIACSQAQYQNNFPGWIGRTDWWFETTDNTPPVLTEVSPLGNCVPVINNKVVFTFEEKNQLLIANLAGQNNNIYIYKVGATVPYEIISAHSATPVRGSGNEWTITYTTLHPYNSEEEYYVLWNKSIFVDNAIPVKHKYTEGLTEVVDYELDANWQKFGFETEDALKPVVDWSFVNRMWVEEYGDEYIYSLADGSYNSNPEGLGATTDVCAMYEMYGGVPTEVGMYVWFNEPVELTEPAGDDWDNDDWMNANFYLNSASVAITLQYLDHGTAVSDMSIDGGGEIPAGSQWFYVKPLNGLVSLGTFDFGVKANVITDVLEEGEDEECRINTLGQINLFDFCTWDETPPTAQLFDGKDHRIEVLNDSIDHCIAEREYVLLKFSKPVVKTINVTVPPQFGNPVDPWWSFSNLFLTEADLKDTDGQIIRFWNETTDEYVVVSDVDIITPGIEYKLWLDEPMASENLYEFEIHEDVLKDMVRIPNGNFFPGEEWDWYVTDWEAPYIVSTTPADEEQNVSPVEPLEVVFNEDVVLGSNARIIIRDNGQPQGVVYNFRADDAAHVTLMNDDQTVVINHGGLDKNTTYYVQIEAGFVYEENCSNLAFDGKSEQGAIKDSWNFKTGDSDGPVAGLWPIPGDECVEIDADLVLTFDENIQLTDKGQIVIYKARDGQWHNSAWPDAMFGDVVAVLPLTDYNFPQIRISGSNAANGLTKNVITVTPPAGLWESDETYYVRITGDGHDYDTEADVVVDVVGNSWMYPTSHDGEPTILLPGIHQNQWYFTIGNNDEPELVDMTPERGEMVEAGVAGATTDLTMTFGDEIAFGIGKIKVYEFIVNPQGGVAAQEANLWKEFSVPEDVASGKISLSGDMKTVTVHDVNLLDGINWYYVIVTPGTITNNVECTLRGWSGIGNPDTWLFSTAPDVTEPELSANAVTSDACSEEYLEPATVAFELMFSEGVSVANGTGLVKIVEAGSTEVVASATITPAMIEEGVVTFDISDFDNGLEDQTAYELVIGGDAIHDLATASLAGKQNPFGRVPFGNENWFEGVVIPFETGDFTAPTAGSFAPDGEVDLENDVTLVATFDEAVQDGVGMLNLYDAEADTLVASFDATDDEDMNDATVTFSVTLPDEMSYYVLIDEGFVTDMLYNESCDEVRGNNAVTNPATWTFGIDDNTAPYITEDLTEDTDNLMKTFDIVLQYDDVITSVDKNKAQLKLGGYAVGGVTDAKIGTDPTQVIVSVTVAEDQKEYMIDLAAGFVMDDAINANASEADETGPYMVGDRTNPVLGEAAPVGILGSYIGVEVMVDFFDDTALTVKKPIIIKNSKNEVVATWTPVLDENQAASFMPELWFDTYTVIIPVGAVVDVNGNEFAGASWSFAVIDNIAPQNSCLTIISPVDGADCVERNVVLEMEFCERMAAGNPTKLVKIYNILEVGGGLSENVLFASFPVTKVMVDGEIVSIPLNGLVDNTSYTVMMDAGALTDEAGNAFVGINDPIRWNFTTGDNTAPTATLMPASSTNDKNEFVVMAKFSEAVDGALTHITVANAISYVVKATASPMEYEVAIKAADMKTVTVTVPVSITDVNCKHNPLAAQVTGTYVVGDNTAPTVAVTKAPVDPTNTMNTFIVELTFSEKVKGVAAGLVGSVGLTGVVTTDDIVYTLTFAGLDETAGKLVLDKTKVTDVSANSNMLAEGIVWDYMVGDHVSPTAAVVPGSGTDLRVQKLDVVVTFNEAVIVPAGGIVVTGGVGTVTSVGNVYNVAITANDGATVTLSLTSLITDDSKNANAFAAKSYTYSFGDRTAPMVTVYKPAAKDTIPTFDVTISFNEKVTGVSATSVTLTGDGAVMKLRTILDGLAYEATITGAEKGTVVLRFSNAIKDLAGNALVPVNFTYTIGDYTAPTVIADPASGSKIVTNMFEVTLTFNEEVSGVAGAVKVSDGTVAVTGSGMVYKAKLNTPSMSTVYLMLGTTIKDLKGNAFDGATFTYNVTGLVPIATIQGNASQSAHVGTKLQVKGTVTGVASGEGFFVQDAVAARSGIWVEYGDVGSKGIKVGDGVVVTGEVAEVADVTTIIASDVVGSLGTPAITPMKVTPSGAETEMYESVLIMVEGPRATAKTGSGEWTIYLVETDNAVVNDWLYTATNVVKDHFYDVTGIVNGRLDAFKIEPRMASDVVDLTLTDVNPVPGITFKVYPNPFHEYIQIDNNDKLSRVVIVNIAGQKVIDIEYPENRIRTANLVSGVYLVNLFTEDGIVKTERIVKR